MKQQAKRWTDAEFQLAVALRHDEHSIEAIAERLGRSVSSVSERLRRKHVGRYVAKRSSSKGLHSFARPTPQMLEAADTRRQAYDRRDMTAEFFGDPPKGFSELDRRGGRCG